MGREYKFRGYRFRATNITTEVKVNRFWQTRTEVRPLYEIDGLKEAGTRPFLTSLNQVKDYIDFYIWRTERQSEKKGESNDDT